MSADTIRALAEVTRERDALRIERDALAAALRALRDECDAYQGAELRESGSTWAPLMAQADCALARVRQ